MTRWFLDASVLLAGEDADDDNYSDAHRLLQGADQLATLDLAFYEVTNVAVHAWRDLSAARRLRERLAAIAGDGGVAQVGASLIASAAALAAKWGISVYDASYVVAAREWNAPLVSCDVRDLISRELACLPRDARV
ncbi:MAG: PIN domain-containing protein [Candidatus Dormibacteria bacterium]